MKCGCDETKTVRYKYTVTVQSITGTPDAYGQIDLDDESNWGGTDTIKVNFISKGGQEFFRAGKVNASVTCIAETPSTNYTRSITSKNRISFESRIFQIDAVYDINEDRRVVRLHLIEKK